MTIDFRNLYALELAVIPVINSVESRGLRWDSKLARREDRKVRKKMASLLESDCMAAVNPNSPPQVKRHFLELGMPEKLLLKKGKVTTGSKQVESAVRHLENDERWQHVGTETVARVTAFSKTLADYRHLAKVSGTYLRPFSDMAERNDGVVYPSLNPFGAVTGRMSGTFQQTPKSTKEMTAEQQVVRRCVVCRDGYATFYFDYAAMEMAVFGTVAGEQRIIDGYDDGEDVHLTMARAIYGDGVQKDSPERSRTKTTTFGLLYGEGPTHLAGNLGVSLAKAKELREMYFETFPAIKDYQNELECELRANGFVQDLFGRRYSLKVGEAYKAVNAVIQGTCASAFKKALCQVDDVLLDDEHIVLVVHDEIVVERLTGLPHEKKFVKDVTDAMQDVAELADVGLRLRVDVKRTGRSWADKK